MKSTITIRIIRNADEEMTFESRHHTQQGAVAGFMKASKSMDQSQMGAGYERLEVVVDGVILGQADMADVHGAAADRDITFAKNDLKTLFHAFLTGKRRPSTAHLPYAA